MSIMESNHSVLTNVKEEIVDLARTLADSQIRLQRIAVQIEENEKSIESDAKIEEIEKKYDEAVNGANWLRTQNDHLQQRLSQFEPEFERLLNARESAFKKLKHARKVIRDLLQERGDMSSPRTQGSLTPEDIAQALGEDPLEQASGSSSSSSSGRSAGTASGSDKTVRLHTRPPSNTSANISSPQLRQHTGTPHHTSPESSRASPPWQIHFKKPPGCAVVLEGPFSEENLQNSLGLADDTMVSLENLATSSDIGIRLHITRLPSLKANVAFLYDPILIDTRQQSYLCDWGRHHTNQTVERHILQHKALDPVFHVFLYPVKEKNWYYIGAMNWEIMVDMKNFWPLEGNSKTKIINKLCRRSRGEIDAIEMSQLLDNFELKQLCVELKGVEHLNISHEFARGVLGLETRPSGSEGL